MGEKRVMSKSGQVTIFIIIAIIIVAAGLLIYSFYPQIKTSFGTQQQNPPSFIQSCIEK
jgi:flagellar basal body-associated protein FliL